MSKSQDKWNALSDASKAQRQALSALLCGLGVVYVPLLLPLSNIVNVICATLVMLLALMLAFGAGTHAGPGDR